MGFDHSGVLVVDKPIGLSSAQTVARIKRIIRVAKIGHTGTLDPMASGVLVCCLNQATKLVTLLQVGHKAYTFCLHLGIETDTQDATGNTVCIQPGWNRSADEIGRVARSFVGEIEQRPPVYSALKHKGVALYRLARRGNPIQKPGRKIRIADIRVTQIDLPLAHMEVDCSKGTYVRTLCADIGHALGCGGHLRMLRRTANGSFDLAQAVQLTELEAAADQGRETQLVLQKMVSMTDALPDLPEVAVDAATQKRIVNGVPLKKDALPGAAGHKAGGCIKVTDGSRNLVALVTLTPGAEKISYFRVFPSCVTRSEDR